MSKIPTTETETKNLPVDWMWTEKGHVWVSWTTKHTTNISDLLERLAAAETNYENGSVTGPKVTPSKEQVRYFWERVYTLIEEELIKRGHYE